MDEQPALRRQMVDGALRPGPVAHRSACRCSEPLRRRRTASWRSPTRSPRARPLRQEAARAGLPRLALGRRVGVGREDHHRDARVGLVDPLHRADAVQVGHRQVHHDRVRAAGAPPRRRPPARRRPVRRPRCRPPWTAPRTARNGTTGGRPRSARARARGRSSRPYIWCTADRVSADAFPGRGIFGWSFRAIAPISPAGGLRHAGGEPSEDSLYGCDVRIDASWRIGARGYTRLQEALGQDHDPHPSASRTSGGGRGPRIPRGTTRHGLRPGG